MRWTDEQRFRLVCAALAGLAARPLVDSPQRVAGEAVALADATLAKLAADAVDGEEWVTTDAAGEALAADAVGSE